MGKNLKTWILDVAADEPIEAVVIGRMGWAINPGSVENDYGADGVPNYIDIPKGTVLTWEDAAPWLDFDCYIGFGAPTIPAFYAWTKTRVIFASQYDGSINLESIPRDPTAELPQMPGG